MFLILPLNLRNLIYRLYIISNSISKLGPNIVRIEHRHETSSSIATSPVIKSLPQKPFIHTVVYLELSSQTERAATGKVLKEDGRREAVRYARPGETTEETYATPRPTKEQVLNRILEEARRHQCGGKRKAKRVWVTDLIC